LLTFLVAVAVSPPRPVAVVVREDVLPEVVRLVEPLLRAFDQLPPLPLGFRLALRTDPRDWALWARALSGRTRVRVNATAAPERSREDL